MSPFPPVLFLAVALEIIILVLENPDWYPRTEFIAWLVQIGGTEVDISHYFVE